MSTPEFISEVDDLRVRAEARFKRMGLVAEYAEDEAYKSYEAHSHHEVWLFGLGGSSVITIDRVNRIAMTRGVQVHIAEGIEHEAIVGRDGAQYLFAYAEGIEPFKYET